MPSTPSYEIPHDLLVFTSLSLNLGLISKLPTHTSWGLMISQLRVETLASHPCSFLEYNMIYCMCRVDHNKLWKVLKEMGIPDHQTCLLRNLYAGQETTDWTWNNRLVPNRKRSMSRLYIVTLLI